MSIAPLTEDQRDALQEVLNIAMGQAGDSLARILDAFVELSVPRIRFVEVSMVTSIIEEFVPCSGEVTAVRQAFFDDLRGEALIIFDQNGCRDLADLMGYDDNLDAQAEQELLLDVSNVLVGAILNGVTNTLGTHLSYSAPSIMAERTLLNQIITPENVPWTHSALLEVNYSLKDRNFRSHLLLFMAEEAIEALRKAVDDFVESF